MNARKYNGKSVDEKFTQMSSLLMQTEGYKQAQRWVIAHSVKSRNSYLLYATKPVWARPAELHVQSKPNSLFETNLRSVVIAH
jgi:hypothetical protein